MARFCFPATVIAGMLAFASAIGPAGDSAAAQTVRPVETIKALDTAAVRRARFTTLGHGALRQFKGPKTVAPLALARQDVSVPPGVVTAKKLPGGNAAPSVSCSHLGMVIGRVTGDITPGGSVTISGICFGPQGDVVMKGSFQRGGVTLAIQSWTDSTITARIPTNIYGVLDQAVNLMLVAPRAFVSKTVTGLRAASSPVQLNFVAARDTIDITKAALA